MSKVDLHIHSSESDGRYSPAEVVRKAAEAGLTLMALTDHDSVDGVAPALEAARSFPELRVIPGAEISTDVSEGEVHVLGYFLDCAHGELLETLRDMRDSRQDRARQMVKKLVDLGLHIDWERVQEIAGDGSIGRPHIAQALMEKGYISSIQEAFNKYLAWGGPAYVERQKITPAEAVGLIMRAGGLPVLAHPLTFKDPEALVSDLKTCGLAGIEAYYKDYTAEQLTRLVSLAGRYGLIVTVGSDYHGLDESAEVAIGGVRVPARVAEQIEALAEQRLLKTGNLPSFQ